MDNNKTNVCSKIKTGFLLASLSYSTSLLFRMHSLQWRVCVCVQARDLRLGCMLQYICVCVCVYLFSVQFYMRFACFTSSKLDRLAYGAHHELSKLTYAASW